MNFRITASVLLFFTQLCVLHCSNNSTYTPPIKNDHTDGITMATPNGGVLKAADEGPVRSISTEPEINTDTFHLTVTGLVDSPLTMTWEEILSFPQTYTDTILMYCVEGWEVWGNWKGVKIADLLEKASLRPEADHIKFTCADGYTTSLPLSYLLRYNIILAHEVNGNPLSISDGFPLRVIAFGKFGYKWAKWITSLEVTDESEFGYWEARGYSDKADVPLDRRMYYEGDKAKVLEY